MQRPIRHIEISPHHSVRIDDYCGNAVSQSYSQQRTDRSEKQPVCRKMPYNFAILKSERLQGSDLCLFADTDAVHCGYHGKDCNGEEKHGQYGSHCLSLFDLAAHAGITLM